MTKYLVGVQNPPIIFRHLRLAKLESVPVLPDAAGVLWRWSVLLLSLESAMMDELQPLEARIAVSSMFVKPDPLCGK
jgi:hypothetical protein